MLRGLRRRIGRHLQALQGFLSLFTLQHHAGIDDLPELLTVTDSIVHYTHRKGTNPVISKEDTNMKYNAISNSEKFWEVIYASIMLTGEEREKALESLQVPANSDCAA